MKIQSLFIGFFVLLMLSINVRAHNGMSEVEGKWYLIVQWKPISTQNIVACWMLFEANHEVTMGIDSTQSKLGTWYVDSLTQRVVASFDKTSYRLIVSDTNMSGTVSTGSSSGYVEATRFKGPYWDSLFHSSKRDTDKFHIRMGVDYYEQDVKVGRIHLGMAFNPGGISFNTEMLSLSVLKKDDKTYISSNALWPLFRGLQDFEWVKNGYQKDTCLSLRSEIVSRF